MQDEDMKFLFDDARKLSTEGFSMLQHQIRVLHDTISILGRLASLRSLTDRQAWPIFVFAALLPFANNWLNDLVPVREDLDQSHFRTFIPADGIGFWFGGHPRTTAQNHYEVVRRSLLRVATDISARPEILTFGAKDWLVHRFDQLSGLIVRAREERERLDGDDNDYLVLLARNLVPISQVGLRALMYLTVAYHPNYFCMPLSHLNFVENSVKDILSSVTRLQRNLTHHIIKDLFKIRNLFECIDFRSTYAIPANPKPYVPHPSGMKIQVKDVSFRYAEKSQDVLKDINFTIEPGEMVSIVGYNGSGLTNFSHFYNSLTFRRKILLNSPPYALG
jgi:ABC-type multidrug transport system fused ATPase/permease subunit